MSIPLGLQLYTVREKCDEDFLGTLSAVAKTGYASVELAGYHDHEPAEVAKVLADEGLQVAACHAALPITKVSGDLFLEGEVEEEIDAAKAVGAPTLVLPYCSPKVLTSLDDYRQLRAILLRLGERCQASGLGFAYHNHGHEAVTYAEAGDEKIGLEILFDPSATDPEVVKAEVDLGWLLDSNVDPAIVLETLQGRCELIHLKDLDGRNDDGSPRFVAVGDGILSYLIPGLLSLCQSAGAKHFLVEQDYNKRRGSPVTMPIVERSIEFLSGYSDFGYIDFIGTRSDD